VVGFGRGVELVLLNSSKGSLKECILMNGLGTLCVCSRVLNLEASGCNEGEEAPGRASAAALLSLINGDWSDTLIIISGNRWHPGFSSAILARVLLSRGVGLSCLLRRLFSDMLRSRLGGICKIIYLLGRKELREPQSIIQPYAVSLPA
jgi:hypothetical protein